MPTKLAPEALELAEREALVETLGTELAERELELSTCRVALQSFEREYAALINPRFAKLDEQAARLAELDFILSPRDHARRDVEAARDRLNETNEAIKTSKAQTEREGRAAPPSDELKSVFRRAARLVHPDFSQDDADREKRTVLMAQLNEAYRKGDVDTINSIVSDFELQSLPDGVGKRLVIAIRRQAAIKERLSVIETELSALASSSQGALHKEHSAAKAKGRDLLKEMARRLDERIEDNAKRIKTLSEKLKSKGSDVQDDITNLEKQISDLEYRLKILKSQ